MVALITPDVNTGWLAQDFNLKGVDGKYYNLATARGDKGLLVMFICNHCPFVKAIMNKIVRDAKELQAQGIGVIAINANDASTYPEDSYDNMQKLAAAKKFSFPYVFDETQQVAKSYDAICTPDFFGFNAQLELQYRGRLEESRMQDVSGAKRELFDAMSEIAKTGKTTIKQMPSMGCNIKWKE